MPGLPSPDAAAARKPNLLKRVANRAGSAAKATPRAAAGLVLLEPFRAGKEAPTPEFTWKPPAERFSMPNQELKDAPKAVKQRFIETQTVSTKLLRERMGDAVKKENDARGDDTKMQALDADKGHQLLRSLTTIDELAARPDGDFPQNERARFIDTDGNPIGNPIYIQNENGDRFRVNQIVGKKGEMLQCEMVAVDDKGTKTGDKRTDYVSAGKVLRGQILAEADTARNLFTGAEQSVFSKYLGGLQGEYSQLDLDEEGIKAFNREIRGVASNKNILTVEDAKPPPNADEVTAQRWKDKLKILADENVNLLDYDTFRMLFAEEIANSVPNLRAELARMQENVKLGVASPAELQDTRDALQAAMYVQRALQQNPGFLEAYFVGSQTGAIPPEASGAVVHAFRNRDLSQFADQVMPEIDEHFDVIRQNKEEYQERVQRVGRNRKIGGGVFLALAALGYFGANKMLKDDE